MDFFKFFVVLLLTTIAFGKPSTSANSMASNAHKFNTRTQRTVFTKIVPSNDLSHHNAIYVTPELLFVGKSNGDILRCLFKDPSVCEMFYSYSSSTGVTSTVISGEYLYASLANGVMLRCQLYQKQCKTFNKFGSSINALAVSAGYIHAGLSDGRMRRCDLDQLNKCKTLNQLQGKITSVGATHDYIYAGLKSAQIWRCSMSSKNSCRLVHTARSRIIQGMAAVEDTVISVSKGGTAWNCTRGHACSKSHVPGSGYTSMAIFNSSLYVMRNSNISVCHWGRGPRNCAPYEHHAQGLSISFAYSTYKMQDRFVNEEKTCLSGARCPPFIVYYKVNERPTLEVFVKRGKLYNSEGVLVDTRDADMAHSGPAAIFAMGADGQILLSKVHSSNSTVLRTSSLFAGHPVAGAGEMVVEDGVIKSIRACSDHYRPTVELNQQVINSLYLKGYTDRIVNLPCCRDNECGQVNPEENTIDQSSSNKPVLLRELSKQEK